MRKLLFYHFPNSKIDAITHNFDTILTFDLENKTLLKKRDCKDVRLVSELACDLDATKHIFESIELDISRKINFHKSPWADIFKTISVRDLYEFDLRTNLGLKINLYVTIKKYLSEGEYHSVTINGSHENWFCQLLRTICKELDVDYVIITSSNVLGREDSHLDFSTTQGVGSSHREFSKNLLFTSISSGHFPSSFLRFLQQIYKTNTLLRALFFILISVSNNLKDLLFPVKRRAVVVCYDKWINDLLTSHPPNVLVIFHMITLPISRKFFKYFCSPDYRFAISFLPISKPEELLINGKSVKKYFTDEAIRVINAKLSREGLFLVQSCKALKNMANRYNVVALVASYDSPSLHRAVMMEAKKINIPSFLNLHGITSSPEFNSEGYYSDYVVSWSNLVTLYDSSPKNRILNYKDPYHSFEKKIRTVEVKKSYDVLIATSNSPVDYCTCLMNAAESRFLELIVKIKDNSKKLDTWNFTVKIHPSENVAIYTKMISEMPEITDCSFKIVKNLADSDYANYDFSICLSPTTFMFDLIERGMPTFYYDFIIHEKSYYDNYLFGEFSIERSMVKDFGEFFRSDAFLTDEMLDGEQEAIRKICRGGSNPALTIEDFPSQTRNNRSCTG